MSTTTKIPAPLESIASGGEVASAENIHDHIREKSQEQLNSELLEGIAGAQEALDEAEVLNQHTTEKIRQFQEYIDSIAISGTTSSASEVTISPIEGMDAVTVQKAIEEIYSKKVYLTEEEYEEFKEARELVEDVEYNGINKEIGKVKTSGEKLDKTIAHFGSLSWAANAIMAAVCVIFCSFLALNKIILNWILK